MQMMQDSQRYAFAQLENVATSPPAMYVDSGGKYHDDYKGPRECHLRVLHNIGKKAANDALRCRMAHNKHKPDKVREIAKKHEKFGNVFHIRK